MATTPNLGLTKIEVGQAQKEATINTNYDLLDAQASVKGTAFPGTPATNTRVFRTDRNIEYFYNGTRWLSTAIFDQVIPKTDPAVFPYAASIASPERMAVPWQGVYDLWLEQFQLVFFVVAGTALGASHKWVSVLSKQVAAGTQTSLAIVNIDSGASNAYRTSLVTINALLGTTHFAFEISHTKTGTPGNLVVEPRLTYRLVG